MRIQPRPTEFCGIPLICTPSDSPLNTEVRLTHRWEGDGFEPSVPREGVKRQSPQFHADYPPIGWAHEQRTKRMLNGFKRDGITAQTGCQPDRLE